ncbi:hypothetical protein BH10BAC5_BH10BAC5_19780 [soil metagenome]
MKKILTVIFVVSITLTFFHNHSNAQISTRFSAAPYVGFGYTFDVFTNSDAKSIYPAISQNFELFKEIAVVGGLRLNRSLALEVSPSFAFTNITNGTGFNYTGPDGFSRYYVPQQLSFTMIPINVRAKYYPFSLDPLSMLSNVYLLGGAGPTYVSENMTNYIYNDNTQSGYQGQIATSNSFWKPNFIFGVGLGSSAKVGYTFELSYRVISLDGLKDKPQITSIAKDLNSINLSAIILFSF